MSSIGYKIRKVRDLKGFKQDDIAKKLNMTQQSYQKYEEKNTIPEDKFKAIAAALEVDPEFLRNFDDRSIFTNNILHDNAQANFNTETIYNQFPPELKMLYEDKITLLETLNKKLEEENKMLNEEIKSIKS